MARRYERSLSVALATIAMALIMTDTAPAQQVKPSCADDSRDCMIAAATAYLDSIVRHDASNVPFAHDVRRTEQGKVTAVGEEQIRALQKLQPDMSGRDDTRFVVDEKAHEVVAFALLRVTGAKADPGRKTFNDSAPAAMRRPATVHLAERFKVKGGLITEIEAIFANDYGVADAPSGWPR